MYHAAPHLVGPTAPGSVHSDTKETDGWKSGRKKKQKAVFSPASNRTTSQIESTVHSFQRRQWRQSPRSSSSPTARSPPGLPAGAPPSPPFSSQTRTVRLSLAGSSGLFCSSLTPFSSGEIGAGNVADVVLGFDDLEPYMVRLTLSPPTLSNMCP